MQYALLIYEDEAIYGDDKDGSLLRDIVGRHMAFRDGLGSSHKGGTGLASVTTATTVRTRGGAKTVHDGPFAESKEQLGGLHIVEAPDLDAAIEIAKRVPLAADGVIEVRPVLGAEG